MWHVYIMYLWKIREHKLRWDKTRLGRQMRKRKSITGIWHVHQPVATMDKVWSKSNLNTLRQMLWIADTTWGGWTEVLWCWVCGTASPTGRSNNGGDHGLGKWSKLQDGQVLWLFNAVQQIGGAESNWVMKKLGYVWLVQLVHPNFWSLLVKSLIILV